MAVWGGTKTNFSNTSPVDNVNTNRQENNTQYLKDTQDGLSQDLSVEVSTRASETSALDLRVDVIEGAGTPQGIGNLNEPSFPSVNLTGASSIHGSTTRNAIFAAFASYLAIGERCLCTGGYKYSGGASIMSSATRTDATTVVINTMDLTGQDFEETVTSGDGTAETVSLAMGAKF